MLIQIHMLQNYAPANLNRDDTGSPKDAMFGGYRRGRISSQCLKRSIRKSATFAEEFEADGLLGVRTKKLYDLLRDELKVMNVDDGDLQNILARMSEIGRESSKRAVTEEGPEETTASEGEAEVETKQLIFLGRRRKMSGIPAIRPPLIWRNASSWALILAMSCLLVVITTI